MTTMEAIPPAFRADRALKRTPLVVRVLAATRAAAIPAAATAMACLRRHGTRSMTTTETIPAAFRVDGALKATALVVPAPTATRALAGTPGAPHRVWAVSRAMAILAARRRFASGLMEPARDK